MLPNIEEARFPARRTAERSSTPSRLFTAHIAKGTQAWSLAGAILRGANPHSLLPGVTPQQSRADLDRTRKVSTKDRRTVRHTRCHEMFECHDPLLQKVANFQNAENE